MQIRREPQVDALRATVNRVGIAPRLRLRRFLFYSKESGVFPNQIPLTSRLVDPNLPTFVTVQAAIRSQSRFAASAHVATVVGSPFVAACLVNWHHR